MAGGAGSTLRVGMRRTKAVRRTPLDFACASTVAGAGRERATQCLPESDDHTAMLSMHAAGVIAPVDSVSDDNRRGN